MSEIVRAGVGVIIVNEAEDSILMMRRRGAHGEGEWGPPGGKMECDIYCENPPETGAREIFEETGVQIGRLIPMGFSQLDRFYDDNGELRHQFVTFFFSTNQIKGSPDIREPEKCSDMEWWSRGQTPQNAKLFLPLRNLIQADDSAGIDSSAWFLNHDNPHLQLVREILAPHID